MMSVYDRRSQMLLAGHEYYFMLCSMRLSLYVSDMITLTVQVFLVRNINNVHLVIVQINNVIMLSDGADSDSDMSLMLRSFRDKYRRLVNNRLLFVNIDLGGRSSG